MASQSPSDSISVEVESFVRGYHSYKDVWEPRVGEVLALEREPHNTVDQLAVSVVRSGRIVGHVPFNLAPVYSHFLKRSFNKGTAEITGEKVNRGGGYGLEVPCIYRLYGPKTYVERAKTMLSSSQSQERPYGVSGLSQN